MANNNINELMKLPIWQMTGEEQYRIIQYALGNGASRGEENATMMPMDMPFAPKHTRIAGVHALALYLECCDSLVYKLRREGVLERLLFRVSAKKSFSTERSHADVQTSTRNNSVPCVLITDNSKYDGREHHHY